MTNSFGRYRKQTCHSFSILGKDGGRRPPSGSGTEQDYRGTKRRSHKGPSFARSWEDRCLGAASPLLIDQYGVRPHKVRVVTFSRNAAAEVARRMCERVRVRTLHSYYLELAEAFDPIIKNSLIHLPPACVWTDCEEELGRVYLPDERETLIQGAESEVLHADENIYRLLRCFEALGDGDVLHTPVTDIVPEFLLVDEAQDLDATQFRVIELLVKTFATKVFLVGDVNQPIYKFRESDASLMGKLDDIGGWPTHSFHLNINYRSTQAIVDFCNDITPDKVGSLPMVAMRKFPSWVPRLAVFEERAKEVRYVAEAVQTYVSMGRPLGDIAVLARTQREAYSLAHKFAETGLPTRIYTGDHVEDEKHRHADFLTISTSHGSKGLEFGVVLVTGCTDGLNKCLTPAELHQEAHLFYVACSRAKDVLVMTSTSRCISRLLFPAKAEHYRIETADSACKTPIFGTFGNGGCEAIPPNRSVTHFAKHAPGRFFDAAKISGLLPRGFPGATIDRVHNFHCFPHSGDLNGLYASAIERVIYRQVMASSLRESGSQQAIKMPDHFASACYLWVKAFEDDWRLKEPTEEEVQRAVADKAEDFGLRQHQVTVHYDNRTLPAFLKPSKDDSHRKTDRYAAAVERIKGSYKRYINFNDDTESPEALKTIADVAVCAHLAYAPAKTHFSFAELHLGDVTRDKNLGLFSCTRRVIDTLISAHFLQRRLSGAEILSVSAGEVITPKRMLLEWGIGTDIDLSTRSLWGVADLIIGDTIVDIKCSVERTGIQAHWVLQLMCYLSLARLKGIQVNAIGIYNPMQGFFWKAPMHHWQRHEELIRAINREISTSKT
jgi:hypothetical protein